MSDDSKEDKVAVIIGGGVAGTSCAIHLNSLLPSIKITLIEPKPSLKLCHTITQLTQTALETNITEENAEQWCNEQNITFIRSKAVSLFPNYVVLEDGKRISFNTSCLCSGASPFVPPALSETWLEEYVLTLRDTDSVNHLKKQLASARRVIVVGAGGIGMEVVYEITGCEVVWVVKSSHIGGLFFDEQTASFIQRFQQEQRDERNEREQKETESDSSKQHGVSKFTNSTKNSMEATETDSSKKPVYSAAVGPDWLGKRDRAIFFDQDGKQVAPKLFETRGRLHGYETARTSEAKSTVQPSFLPSSLTTMTDCEVSKVYKSSSSTWPIEAKLSNGATIGCDLIIVGTGVTANIDFLQGSGVDISHSAVMGSGVRVQPGEMETNVRGIFAAGDCTVVDSDSMTDWLQMRTWNQAMVGGRTAAHAMASHLMNETNLGMGLEFEVFAHSTHFFGCKVVLLGNWKAQGLNDGFKILERHSKNSFVRVVLQNGRVRGAVLIGDVENAEVYENLILGQMNVEWMGEDLISEDVDLDHFFD